MPFRHEDTSAFEPEDLEILRDIRGGLAEAWPERPWRSACRGSPPLGEMPHGPCQARELDVPLMLERCLAQFNSVWLMPEGVEKLNTAYVSAQKWR
jgi:hypothetical protein